MPSLKDLRNRISSVKATRKITKAMQMVAAAKLRRAQEAAVAAGHIPTGWRQSWAIWRKQWRGGQTPCRSWPGPAASRRI